MATQKKKHLIELMIEAGVKWPDGAEYAAQDKKDNKVQFYKNGKPNPCSGWDAWMADNCTFMTDKGITLPALCSNWHQTIVTREQYAEALAAANTSGKTNQVRESEDVPASQPAAKYCASVMRQMPDETIESLLSEIKAKREERDALVAKAEVLALDIASIEQQVNDKLKEYGFAISPVVAPSDPVHPKITDWRDLRVGDVIWIGDSTGISNAPSDEYTIIELDFDDKTQPVAIEWSGRESWPDLVDREWRFIRRP